jgi:hypothetical protein
MNTPGLYLLEDESIRQYVVYVRAVSSALINFFVGQLYWKVSNKYVFGLYDFKKILNLKYKCKTSRKNAFP